MKLISKDMRAKFWQKHLLFVEGFEKVAVRYKFGFGKNDFVLR